MFSLNPNYLWVTQILREVKFDFTLKNLQLCRRSLLSKNRPYSTGFPPNQRFIRPALGKSESENHLIAHLWSWRSDRAKGCDQLLTSVR